MNSVCFASGLNSYTQEYGNSLIDIISILFFFSVAIGVLLAPVFLLIYQAFVKMLMRVKNPQTSHFELTPDVRPQPLLSKRQHHSILDEMQKRNQYFTWVFSGSVLLYTVLLAALIYLIVGIEPDEISRLYTSGNSIGEALLPILFTLLMTLPLLSQLFPAGLYQQLLGVIFGIVGISIGFAYLYTESFTDNVALLEEASGVLVFVILFVGFAVQKVRNIAVLIILVSQLIIVPLFSFFLFIEILKSCGSLDFMTEDQRSVFLFFVGFPLTLFLFWAIWRMAMWMISKLVNAYDRRVFSDFQLQTALWLLLITLLYSLAMGEESAGDDALYSRDSIYPALVLVFCVGLFWFSIRRVPPWNKPQKLLYLRVFATNKYSERLFDFISKYWRHIGPVNMIGGPDLALMNLDIKEAYYLLFKRKQIHELFIDDPASLTDRLQHMSYKPSSDRQYSINEFFCTDNMWKETVTRLVEQADHVLLDLRGFNHERKGAAFELQLLSKMDLLQHTTVVVDSQTDWTAIKQALNTTENTLPEDRVILLDSRKVHKRVLLHFAG